MLGSLAVKHLEIIRSRSGKPNQPKEDTQVSPRKRGMFLTLGCFPSLEKRGKVTKLVQFTNSLFL